MNALPTSMASRWEHDRLATGWLLVATGGIADGAGIWSMTGVDMQAYPYSSTQIPLAKGANGELVGPSDVPRGLACGAHCMDCGQPLINRRGKIKRPHFAHCHQPGADCENARETALHLAAKQVITENTWLTVPAGTIEVRSADMIARPIIERRHLFSARSLKVESAVMEISAGDFVPDVTTKILGKPLFVEIYVTHAVDDEKKRKIRAGKTPCVEITIPLSSAPLCAEEFRNYVLHEANRRWIHHRILASALPGLRLKAENRAEQFNNEIRAARSATRTVDLQPPRESSVSLQRGNAEYDSTLDGILHSTLGKLYELGRGQKNPDLDRLILVHEIRDLCELISDMQYTGRPSTMRDISYNSAMKRLLTPNGARLAPVTWSRVNALGWNLFERATREYPEVS